MFFFYHKMSFRLIPPFLLIKQNPRSINVTECVLFELKSCLNCFFMVVLAGFRVYHCNRDNVVKKSLENDI